MADLICGHKSGLFKGTYLIDAPLATHVGRPEWSNGHVCNTCNDAVVEHMAALLDGMTALSVESPQGQVIDAYLGLVTGQAVIVAGAVTEFASDFTDFLGTDTDSFASKVGQGEQACLRMMKHKALKAGANAVVGVDIDYTEFSGAKGTMLIVATGTAVRLRGS